MPRPLKTIWLWPTAAFPRRVMYYLKAKELPISHLHDISTNPHGDLQFLPMTLNRKLWKIEPANPNVEDRPDGCSIPVIRVASSCPEKGDGDYLVRQSSSILEYLEESYPPNEGYRDLTGGTMQKRAQARDMVALLGEIFQWIGVDLFHTNALTLRFSGMQADQQVASAGEQGRKWWKGLMGRLEQWVVVGEEEEEEGNNVSLIGGTTPTLPDFTLAAMTKYFKEMYGLDILQDFEVLGKWLERYSQSRWYLSREQLEEMEDGGFYRLFRE